MSTSRRGEKPFGLIEMGSNSLKFYLVPEARRDRDGSLIDAPDVVTRKFPWNVAHEYFERGEVSERTLGDVVETVRRIETVAGGVPLSSMLAVATGIFREIDGVEELAARVLRETGVRMRIISGSDEAGLMARCFAVGDPGRSAFIFDLGGATLEWALLIGGSHRDRGSLPLGAIRGEYALREHRGDLAAYLQHGASWCDRVLATLPRWSRAAGEPPEILLAGTGGTVKAAARSLERGTIDIAALRQLIERVGRDGAPRFLKPARRAVLLPGLVILWRMLVHWDAARIIHGRSSVRDGMAARLVRLLDSYRREDLHSTLLLHTTDLRRRDD